MLEPRLRAELDTVPDFAAFATVDELLASLSAIAVAHPDVANVRRVGTSRLGEPLLCLSVGDGPLTALVFAMPHPNEPVGGLTALHLASRMSQDEDLRRSCGVRWLIVPCIDPDGTRLNEEWFGGPFTRGHYSRHFYRPAGDEQVEWTFPFQYKRAYFDSVMPETLALMRLIDTHQPALMCSLHNAELGGVYYYLSRPEHQLYAALQEIPQSLGLALDTGEPEAPHIVRLSRGIYRTISTEDAYDYTEDIGIDPLESPAGTSSADYAATYGTLSLVSEVPYWTSAEASDGTLTTTSYAAVLGEQARGLSDLAAVLHSTLAESTGDLNERSPFVRATRYFAKLIDGLSASSEHRAGLPENERQATVAERFSCLDLVHSFRLRYGGMLLRALDAEVGIGLATPAVRASRAVLRHRYLQWCEAAEHSTPAEVIPIRKLVATQYAATLAAAWHVTAVP